MPRVKTGTGRMIGYTAAGGYVSLRLTPSVTVHDDVYDDRGFEQKIDEYDRRSDARHSIARDHSEVV